MREIKIGDYILFENRYNKWLEQVEKITKNYIKCEKTTVNKKYMRVTNENCWNITTVTLCEEDDVKRIKENFEISRLARELNHFDFSKLQSYKIREICKMVGVK